MTRRSGGNFGDDWLHTSILSSLNSVCLQRALGTSAQLHKRALHLQRTCNAKDAFIAQQQAALESKDHATSNMQSTIARLTKSATEQERIIAEQQAAIAALQVHITKLVSHEHSDKHKTHQQSSQVGILTKEHPSQCLISPISCCHVRMSSCTLTHRILQPRLGEA